MSFIAEPTPALATGSEPMMDSVAAIDKTKTQESTVHCSSLAVAPSSLTRVGKATFRMVLSIPMMTRLRERTARACQRRARQA